LAALADQFLVAYAQQSACMPAPTLFLVGHALELYLKALLQKHDPSLEPKSQGHKVGQMIEKLNSTGILSLYQVKDNLRDRFLKSGWRTADELSKEDDYPEFIANQEMYWIAYFLADLKYLGTQHLLAPTAFGVAVRARNPYWASIFREIRSSLGHSTFAGFTLDDLSDQFIDLNALDFLRQV